jgi:hypothetical protein
VFVYPDGVSYGNLINVHPESACAGARGCGIHNKPSDHPLMDAPMNWREDRGILERICEHGVGHPDYDAAQYLTSIGQGYQNTHGCDGCCLKPGEERDNYR